MSPEPSETNPGRPVRDFAGMAFAAGFIGLAIWALSQTGRMSPLGAVFPRTIASAMIVFAAGYLIVALLRPRVPPDLPGGSLLRRGILIVMLFTWVLLLERLGFFVASIIGFGLICTVANYDRWHWRRVLIYIAVTVAMVGAFQLLFAQLLNVPLPEGRWFK